MRRTRNTRGVVCRQYSIYSRDRADATVSRKDVKRGGSRFGSRWVLRETELGHYQVVSRRVAGNGG